MARKTGSGLVFEEGVAFALRRAGFDTHMQQTIGQRLGGGRHRVDIVATRDHETILVSLKWQQESGTAEQKVPYEYLCLAQAVAEDDSVDHAYLVLGGNGWTKRDFFVDELENHLGLSDNVTVIEGNDFIAMVNRGLR